MRAGIDGDAGLPGRGVRGNLHDAMSRETVRSRAQPLPLRDHHAVHRLEIPGRWRQQFADQLYARGNVCHQLRGKRDLSLVDAGGPDVNDRLFVGPRTRNQFDGIEADAKQQIGILDERTFEGAVREDAGEVRRHVRHDTLRLIRHHRRYTAARAQGIDRLDVERTPGAKTDQQQRTPRAGEDRRQRRGVEQRDVLGRSILDDVRGIDWAGAVLRHIRHRQHVGRAVDVHRPARLGHRPIDGFADHGVGVLGA